MNEDLFDLGTWPVAILAGGRATRLRPATENMPKALLKVAGAPFLTHQLRLLQSAGIRKAVLCVGHYGEMIRKQFGDGAEFGMELSYSFDGPDLLGTGGAVKKALPLLGKQFFVLYGDSYLPIDYAPPARAFAASVKLALMVIFRNEDQWDRSNVWFENGVIKSYSKKEHVPEMKYIDYGLGLLRAEALLSYPDNQPLELADVYGDLIGRKELVGYEVTERFYEIGSLEGLAELDTKLRDKHQLSAAP